MPMKMRPLPSKDLLLSLLSYDESTGDFTRLSNGKIAGFIYTRTDGKRRDVRIKIKGESFLAHRLAWMFIHDEDPGEMEIDHINGDSTDNRAKNLRKVRRALNCRNAKIRSDNSTGITGVCFDISNGNYLVQIGSDKGRKRKSVQDFFEACCIRKSWEKSDGTYSKRHGR